MMAIVVCFCLRLATVHNVHATDRKKNFSFSAAACVRACLCGGMVHPVMFFCNHILVSEFHSAHNTHINARGQYIYSPVLIDSRCVHIQIWLYVQMRACAIHSHNLMMFIDLFVFCFSLSTDVYSFVNYLKL